MNGLLDVWMDW